jgi:hypothetical protein
MAKADFDQVILELTEENGIACCRMRLLDNLQLRVRVRRVNHRLATQLLKNSRGFAGYPAKRATGVADSTRYHRPALVLQAG